MLANLRDKLSCIVARVVYCRSIGFTRVNAFLVMLPEKLRLQKRILDE